MEAHLAGRLADSDFTEYYESLQTDLALAKSEVSLAEASDLDANIPVNYLGHLCWNMQILWLDNDSDGKQRLQKVRFPAGVEYDPKQGFGIPFTSFFTRF